MDLKHNDNYNILILSRAFRAGDAITTINLFAKWPKEHLFCASPVESEYATNLGGFYLLGDKEITYRFPFNKISRPTPSRIGVNKNITAVKVSTKSLISKIYENFGRPLLQRMDLYETRLRFNISPEFEEWIKRIKPSAIYTSVGDSAMALFVLEIHERFPNIKIIIHGFDDWFSPSYKILNESRHRIKAETLFKRVLDIASGFFTSSEKMAKEYSIKYNRNFICFPNPVKIVNTTNDTSQCKYPNVVFTGKVGWHNSMALRDMVMAIEQMNKNGKVLYFDIYTDTKSEEIANSLGKLPQSVRIHKPVPNNEIPPILAAASVVYLPISIDSQTAKFTRYSMSTKMGEYLVSGSPMIYYGPEGIAMTEFLLDKNCSELVTSRGTDVLVQALNRAIYQVNEEMLQRAKIIADQFFNLDNVSKRFKDKVTEIVL